MSAKQLLIDLFSLPQQEIIFQDYGCALKQLFTKYGRMFLSENHYCFYANIGGIKTKIVINIEKVQTLELKGKNDIDVLLKDGKLYQFSSFNDRDSVFSLMNALLTGTPANFIGEPSIGLDESLIQSSQLLELQEIDKIQDAEVEVNFLTPEMKDNTALELMKVILPVNVDKFFEYFLADDASVYSLLHHRQAVLDTETQVSKWQEEQSGFQREVKSIIKLKDVPFKDKSRMHKIQTFKKEGTTITVCSTTNTLDVPYANHFQAEERWEVTEFEGDANKCLLRCFGWIVFLKSTYMKKMINTRSVQGYKEDYEIWVNNVRKRLEQLSAKQSSQIQGSSHSHEYEDSNIRTSSIRQENKEIPQIGLIQKLRLINIQTLNPLGSIILVFIFLLLIVILMKLKSVEQHLQSINQRLALNFKDQHNEL